MRLSELDLVIGQIVFDNLGLVGAGSRKLETRGSNVFGSINLSLGVSYETLMGLSGIFNNEQSNHFPG